MLRPQVPKVPGSRLRNAVGWNWKFANVVPPETKDGVLERLCQSDQPFEAVSDLCEMSAQNDPRLKAIAESEGKVKIAACYPRAVKWLFHAAEAPLPEEGVEVVNMDRILLYVVSKLVRFPIHDAGFYSTARHPDTEASRMMVTPACTLSCSASESGPGAGSASGASS